MLYLVKKSIAATGAPGPGFFAYARHSAHAKSAAQQHAPYNLFCSLFPKFYEIPKILQNPRGVHGLSLQMELDFTT